MRAKKYVLYDDLRKVGEYETLKGVWDTGLIRSNKTYFYKTFAEERFYAKENICVYEFRDLGARCCFLGHAIARRARLSPDVSGLNKILTKTLEDMTNNIDLGL